VIDVLKRLLPRKGHPFWKLSALTSVLLLLALTLTPKVSTWMPISQMDKIYHFIGFFGVSYVVFFASTKRPQWLLLSCLFALGILIEIGQHFIPGREFSWLDWVADCVGVLAAFAWVKWVEKI